MIDPNGNIVAQDIGAFPIAETVSFVPTDLGLSGNPVEGFYDANFAVDIQKASANDFVNGNLLGDAIVTGEFGSSSPVWAVSYTGNVATPGNLAAPFSAKVQVGTEPNQSEDGIFVTAQRINDVTPEPSTLFPLAGLMGGLGYLIRRRRQNA